MKQEEASEIKCVGYLKEMYGNDKAVFCRKGGLDTAVSDIKLLPYNKIKCFIVGDVAARSGQFALRFYKDKKFFICFQTLVSWLCRSVGRSAAKHL